MSKILVFRNQSEIDRTFRNFNDHIGHYQNVIKEFNDLGIASIEDRDQFMEAVSNPRQFIQDKLSQRIELEPVYVAGIRLKVDKLMEMMDVAEINEFVKAADAAKHALFYFQRIGNIKAGQVFMDKKLLESFTESGGISLYASTEKQIKTYEALKLMIEATEALKAAGASFHFESVRLAEMMYFNESAKNYELRPEYFQRISG